MGRRLSPTVVSIVPALLSISPCFGHFDSASASAQGQETKILSSVFYIIQGENDVMPCRDSVNDFYAHRVISYDLPYGVTRVYTKLSVGAGNITLLGSSQGQNPSYRRELAEVMRKIEESGR